MSDNNSENESVLAEGISRGIVKKIVPNKFASYVTITALADVTLS